MALTSDGVVVGVVGALTGPSCLLKIVHFLGINTSLTLKGVGTRRGCDPDVSSCLAPTPTLPYRPRVKTHRRGKTGCQPSKVLPYMDYIDVGGPKGYGSFFSLFGHK